MIILNYLYGVFYAADADAKGLFIKWVMYLVWNLCLSI